MRLNLPVSSREVTVAETANILSTTDLQGTITYANPDFVAISGFTEDELLGEHHNTVRHPDMPEAAFADLWQTLQANKSWMGVVKNRCKNGDHYWVSAFATPVCRDGKVVEYQSVRTRPQPDISRQLKHFTPSCVAVVGPSRCAARWVYASARHCLPLPAGLSVLSSAACSLQRRWQQRWPASRSAVRLPWR